MCSSTLRVSADPWTLILPLGLIQRPQIMKSVKIHHATKPVHHEISTLVIITDMALTLDLSLVYKLGRFAFLSRSDIRILSTSHLKTRLAIDIFGLRGQLLSPRALLQYEL